MTNFHKQQSNRCLKWSLISKLMHHHREAYLKSATCLAISHNDDGVPPHHPNSHDLAQHSQRTRSSLKQVNFAFTNSGCTYYSHTYLSPSIALENEKKNKWNIRFFTAANHLVCFGSVFSDKLEFSLRFSSSVICHPTSSNSASS